MIESGEATFYVDGQEIKYSYGDLEFEPGASRSQTAADATQRHPGRPRLTLREFCLIGVTLLNPSNPLKSVTSPVTRRAKSIRQIAWTSRLVECYGGVHVTAPLPDGW